MSGLAWWQQLLVYSVAAVSWAVMLWFTVYWLTGAAISRIRHAKETGELR